jgi:hypothetical protein
MLGRKTINIAYNIRLARSEAKTRRKSSGFGSVCHFLTIKRLTARGNAVTKEGNMKPRAKPTLGIDNETFNPWGCPPA